MVNPLGPYWRHKADVSSNSVAMSRILHATKALKEWVGMAALTYFGMSTPILSVMVTSYDATSIKQPIDLARGRIISRTTRRCELEHNPQY